MTLANGISFNAASGGTGSFVFSSSVESFLTLAQAVTLGELVDGQIVSYLAQDSISSPTQREWGHGTFSASGNSIARTTVLGKIDSNTNVAGSGSPLNFATPPVVALTLLAEDVSGLIMADTTFHISTTGSDVTGNGSSAKPFASLNRAAVYATQFNWNGFNCTFSIANGTYTVPAGYVDTTVIGLFNAGVIAVVGNTTTPSNVVLNVTGSNQLGLNFVGGLATYNRVDGGSVPGVGFLGANFTLGGVRITGGDTSLLRVNNGASLGIINNIEINCVSTGNNNFCDVIRCNGGSIINEATITVGGTSTANDYVSLVSCQSGEVNLTNNGGHMTIASSLDFTCGSAFYASLNAAILTRYLPGGRIECIGGVTNPGNAVGIQFIIQQGGDLVIGTNVPNAPGSAGVPGTQGGYVDKTGTISNGNTFTHMCGQSVTNSHSPTNGSTVTLLPWESEVLLTPSGDLATLTIKLPDSLDATNASNGNLTGLAGDHILILCTHNVTTLTLQASGSDSIVGAATALTANVAIRYFRGPAISTWYPA